MVEIHSNIEKIISVVNYCTKKCIFSINNNAILSGLLILNVKPEALEIFYAMGGLDFLNGKIFAPSCIHFPVMNSKI